MAKLPKLIVIHCPKQPNPEGGDDRNRLKGYLERTFGVPVGVMFILNGLITERAEDEMKFLRIISKLVWKSYFENAAQKSGGGNR